MPSCGQRRTFPPQLQKKLLAFSLQKDTNLEQKVKVNLVQCLDRKLVCIFLLFRNRKGAVRPVRCKLPEIMAEGSSKALDDVTLPAEEKEEEEEEIVTLDFDDDTLTGELSAAFFSRRVFVIMFPVL